MGGNLFKAGRISSNEYCEIIDSLLPVLKEHFGDRFRIPVAYRNKKDYGDVDIIVDAGILINRPNWKAELNADLGVTQVHSVRNVHSMLYRNFQTDIFLVGTNKLETCYNFMSYNILGNLIGRIYHKFNLRYGEDGLHYVLRGYNNHISKEILVSRDLRDMLLFLGLSYKRWEDGFTDVEEIFEYVIECPYFCANSYDPKYFNVQKRAAERPDFNRFLDYLDEKKIDKNYAFDKNKDVYIELIDGYFHTDLRSKYNAHVERQRILMQVSKKFNGRIVMELVGLNGKELGEFIGVYKNFYSEDFEPYILKTSQEEINENIILLYQNTL